MNTYTANRGGAKIARNEKAEGQGFVSVREWQQAVGRDYDG